MRTPSAGKPARKASCVRHTRAIQRDRRQHPPSAPPPMEVTARLTELVYPAALNTLSEFRRRGLRERVLTLPVMVALVLALIWRQLSGVAELARLVQQELVFWVPPRQVSAQAWEPRLRGLPAELFRQVFERVLPSMRRGRNASGLCPQSLPGRKPTSAGCWPVMPPRSMPCCARSACCGSGPATRWPDG